MGLEFRHGTYIYTRSARVGGKVKREYVGSGEAAIVAFKMDQIEQRMEREVRRLQQADWEQEIEAADALDAAVDAVCEEAATAFRAVMDAAGYRQHARGQWRKKRQEKTNEDKQSR